MTTTGIPEPTPPPAAPPPPLFSAGMLIVGLLISLLIGAVANIFAGLIGMSTNNPILAFLAGIVPGALFAGISLIARRNGLAQGLLIGGCIIALIGGACGASMVGTSFH